MPIPSSFTDIFIYELSLFTAFILIFIVELFYLFVNFTALEINVENIYFTLFLSEVIIFEAEFSSKFI